MALGHPNARAHPTHRRQRIWQQEQLPLMLAHDFRLPRPAPAETAACRVPGADKTLRRHGMWHACCVTAAAAVAQARSNPVKFLIPQTNKEVLKMHLHELPYRFCSRDGLAAGAHARHRP
eukprot:350675-Chlamydomonas_euryale.AAC.3